MREDPTEQREPWGSSAPTVVASVVAVVAAVGGIRNVMRGVRMELDNPHNPGGDDFTSFMGYLGGCRARRVDRELGGDESPLAGHIDWDDKDHDSVEVSMPSVKATEIQVRCGRGEAWHPPASFGERLIPGWSDLPLAALGLLFLFRKRIGRMLFENKNDRNPF